MPRSILALVVLALAIAACAQSSQSPVVTAPSTTEPAAVTAAQPAPASSPAPSPAPPATPPATLATGTPSATGATPPATAPSASASSPASASTVPARYRACAADADCVAVARAACCNHGWKEAVSTSQKDAYAQDFACKAARRPICPMFMVRDARVAKCDAQQKLCVMVEP